MGQPKASFKTKLEFGDILEIAVFPTTKDPNAEVLAISLQRPPTEEGEQWETLGRMAVYRSADGKYSKLPDKENGQ